MSLLGRVSKLNPNTLLNACLANSKLIEYIISLNTTNQLFDKGVDSQGNVVGTYSIATEFISGGEKRAGDNFTLKDTGAFYDSFRILIGEKEFTIEANTIKENKDLLDYSDYILGLTDESKIYLNEVLLGQIIPKIKAAILND